MLYASAVDFSYIKLKDALHSQTDIESHSQLYKVLQGVCPFLLIIRRGEIVYDPTVDYLLFVLFLQGTLTLRPSTARTRCHTNATKDCELAHHDIFVKCRDQTSFGLDSSLCLSSPAFSRCHQKLGLIGFPSSCFRFCKVGRYLIHTNILEPIRSAILLMQPALSVCQASLNTATALGRVRAVEEGDMLVSNIAEPGFC